jgi:hypothetical protein
MSRISIKTKADLPADLRPLWDKMRPYGDFATTLRRRRPCATPHSERDWRAIIDAS